MARYTVFGVIALTAVALIASTACAFAGGGGSIRGRVVAKPDATPLPFANIRVAGTLAGTTAGVDGVFRVARLTPGSYTLVVSAVGYSTKSVDVSADSAGGGTLVIELDEQPALAPEMSVIAQAPVSAATSASISAASFDLRPKLSTQDLLRMVPGLVIAQHAGGGKAEQIYIRGFDCDHGTDINISIDGVPVNMPSHGHGQGYADLHFVMPEALKGFDVHKGPYFAQDGDFGTAGSVRFNTLDRADRSFISMEQGQYGLSRIAGVINVPTGSEAQSALIAAEQLHNRSYFDNDQKFDRVNLYGKYKSLLPNGASISAWGSFFTSHWDASGQIPERAIASGLIERWGAIDPSEGGSTSRQTVNLAYSGQAEGSGLAAQLYASRYHFNLFSNFTFFLDDTSRGDEIEQDDDRTIIGGRAEWSAQTGAAGGILSGVAFRNDWIHNQLWHAERQIRLDPRADADIRETNIAGYLRGDYQLSPWLRIQPALRGDLFLFHGDDLLNGGRSESKTQGIISPKFNAIFTLSRETELYGNFGCGFHSNDARGVLAFKDEQTLPRAIGGEVGARYAPEPGVSFGGALWSLRLDHELVYAGDDGTTELKGATRRAGVDLDGRIRLLDWLWLDAECTVSRGRFIDEPDSASEIPLAPAFTSSGGLTLRGGGPVEGSLRWRSIDDRPAVEDNSVRAHGYAVFTAAVAYRIGESKLTLIADNLFNTEWNEAQFETTSRLKGEPAPVDELHFTAGNPFLLKLKAEVGF